jgi:predicted HAD superfamily hydrolase
MKLPARTLERLTIAYNYVALGEHRLGDRLTAGQRASFLGASLVSIDVFDTALRRTIARPDDVFALMAWRYLHHGAAPADEIDARMKAIVSARIEAERRARAEAADRGVEEVTLDDIYAAFDSAYSSAERAAMQAEELAGERRLCVGNPTILALYQLLVEAGIPVVFTSDTYFDEAFVGDLLRGAGYTANHTVLASSRFKETKRTGSLFARVCALARRGGGPVYHVGDNLHSDVRQARSRGLRGIWYRPTLRANAPDRVATSEKRLAEAIVNGLRAVASSRGEGRPQPDWEQVGTDVAFPLLLGFAQWLATLVTTSRPSSILFCARDGLILKRMYDELARRRPDLPRSSYLEVSRRTLAFPSIDRIDTIELRFLSRSMMPIPVSKYVSRIGLSVDDHIPQIEAAGLAPDEYVTSKDARLATLFTSLAGAIIDQARAERTMLLRYLDGLDCLAGEHIGLCDVGWHGSMQRALERLFEKQGVTSTISGYYIGAFPDDLGEHDKGPMNGWLADKVHAERVPVLYRCVELIEFITTARHGSVSRYEQRDGSITAVYEAEDEDGLARSAAAATIQDRALELARRYLELFEPYTAARISADLGFAAIERFAERPTLLEARMIGALKHVDSYAAVKSKPIAERLSLARVVSDPKSIMAAYKKSLWPRGFSVLLLRNAALGIAADRLYLFGRAFRHSEDKAAVVRRWAGRSIVGLHPLDRTGRHRQDDRSRRDIAIDDRSGPDDRAFPDADTAFVIPNEDRVNSDRNVVLDDDSRR